jgi:hypothetical protein
MECALLLFLVQHRRADAIPLSDRFRSLHSGLIIELPPASNNGIFESGEPGYEDKLIHAKFILAMLIGARRPSFQG